MSDEQTVDEVIGETGEGAGAAPTEGGSEVVASGSDSGSSPAEGEAQQESQAQPQEVVGFADCIDVSGLTDVGAYVGVFVSAGMLLAVLSFAVGYVVSYIVSVVRGGT